MSNYRAEITITPGDCFKYRVHFYKDDQHLDWTFVSTKWGARREARKYFKALDKQSFLEEVYNRETK